MMWNLTIGKNIECALEAVLFSLGESVEIERLAEALEVREDEIRDSVKSLQKKYEKENRQLSALFILFQLLLVHLLELDSLHFFNPQLVIAGGTF